MASESRFHDLLALASERSGDKRRELLRAVTDMFLEDPQAHGEQEHKLFDDVVCRLTDDVDAGERRALADRIADVDRVPRGIIRKLAHDDEIDVAEPILRLSPILQDDDLIEIAEGKSQSHILAMAKRSKLNEGVTDTIAKHGDKTVLRTLSGNRGARLSEDGASLLISRGQADQEILSNLYVRDDLPSASVRSVKKAVRCRPGLAEELNNRAGREIVDRCTDLFAEASKMAPERVKLMLLHGRPEMLVIVARTIDLSRLELERLLNFRIGQTSESVLVVNQTLQRFDVMPQDVAQRVVRFLRTRQVHDAA